MHIRHPRDDGDGGPDVAIDVNGDTVTPDENGQYDIGDARHWLDRYASANGVTAADLIVAETCDTVKSDGNVCGRELPCPYHSED